MIRLKLSFLAVSGLFFPRYDGKQLSRSTRLFFIGLTAVTIGLLLLLLTMEVLPSFFSVWPGLLVFFGIYLLYRGYQPAKREGAIFVGFALLFCGTTLVLFNSVFSWAVIERMWPLFLMVLPLALLFYGLQRPQGARAVYTVPAVVLMTMAVIFLLFSLGVIEVSFKMFMSRWWPLSFVLLGAAAMLQTAFRQRCGHCDNHHDDEPLDIEGGSAL